MSKMQIKYVSDDALAYLRANIDFVTRKLVENPESSDWLKQCIEGEVFVAKKYEIERFSLSIPKDSKDRETDFANSIILYEHLNHLPRYVLTDERFWIWINFELGYEVALKYMPVTLGSSVFKDHWLFTQGKRRGLFFGVLSRCYFRVSLTVDETLKDRYELTRFVIANPERFRNLSWRTFSSEKAIVLGALKAEKRVVDEYDFEEKNDIYPELAHAISRAGSVRLLDCMTEKEIETLVFSRYLSLLGIEEKRKDDEGPIGWRARLRRLLS